MCKKNKLVIICRAVHEGSASLKAVKLDRVVVGHQKWPMVMQFMGQCIEHSRSLKTIEIWHRSYGADDRKFHGSPDGEQSEVFTSQILVASFSLFFWTQGVIVREDIEYKNYQLC